MKKVFSVIVALLHFMTTYAQYELPLVIEDSQTDAYLQNRHPATLTIQINNAPDSIKEVGIKCSFVTFGSELQTKKYYKTNSNGFVNISLDQNLPYQQIWLNVSNYLYAGIYVNTNLNVIIDVSKLKGGKATYIIGDGISYSGADGELNTVMSKRMLYKQSEQNTLIDNLYSSGIRRKGYTKDLFARKIDSIWQAISRINNEFIHDYPNYAWAINNESIAGFYANLIPAYWGDTMPAPLAANIKNHTPYFTSNNGVLFYKYLSDYEYTRILGQSIASTVKMIDRLYSGPRADILKIFLLRQGKDSFAVTYPAILNSMKVKWCKKVVANEFTETAVRQRKADSLLAAAKKLNNTGRFIGKPIAQLPFNASLYALDTINNVNDFIINLKSRFKDTALIIDFWATWCAPCLQDMPVSKKLHESNKDLPLAYVYICTTTSSNMNLWKNRIANMQLPGTHIFMNENIVNDLKSSLDEAGAGFPTYVVIDAGGKLRPKAIESMQGMDRNKLKAAVGLP